MGIATIDISVFMMLNWPASLLPGRSVMEPELLTWQKLVPVFGLFARSGKTLHFVTIYKVSIRKCNYYSELNLYFD